MHTRSDSSDVWINTDCSPEPISQWRKARVLLASRYQDVANPASLYVHLCSRQSHAMTPSSLSFFMSDSLIPMTSRKTSSVCCPKSGGGVLMLGSEWENFTGVLTNFIGPQAGCSISLTIPRASTTTDTLSQNSWMHSLKRGSYRVRGSMFPEYRSPRRTAYRSRPRSLTILWWSSFASQLRSWLQALFGS